MVKGEYTFEEVQACVEAVGGEIASGWSENAITIALMAVVTNWMAARCMNGSSIAAETAMMTEYLSGGVLRQMEEVLVSMRGAH